ncbi:hypothetical protein M5J14_23975 [Lysinibacillus sp. OL1_EC]|uniref:hypothetical protein n=1 Tax=Lysinibacillus sp. OL1_EC TaxID=2943493 RepID=UPI00202FEC08|nr:hypothetical protein [Lysinibacillus sp. OL1_EC]MCM0627528.1 hypothetical protein [Lysinibacillus sp. OL1_EC]
MREPSSLEDVSGWGVKAVMDGREWKVGKAEFVGIDSANQFAGGKSEQLAADGKTIVFIANDEGDYCIDCLKGCYPGMKQKWH